ncbi:MAG: NAD-glutamate dehydrogenase [Hyphomicrobiales bacterium]|nr:MAG: NAD-glutamate dehydrogenase [Hyphomicrobiales bacterium]
MDREAYFRKFLRRATQRLRIAADPPRLTDVQFPLHYHDATSTHRAARDLLLLSLATDTGDAADLTRDRIVASQSRAYDFRICSLQMHPLDRLIPLLHNLGLIVLDQMQFIIAVKGEPRFLRSFRVIFSVENSPPTNKKSVLAAFVALLHGDVEDDSLNQLIVRVGFGWRDVDLLRAYCNYYLQLGGRFGRSRLYQALLSERAVTKILFSYFEARFRPDDTEERSLDALAEIRQRISDSFDTVSDVSDDRILRDLFNIIDATLRTNFYLEEKSSHRNTIALKIDSMGVISAPTPKPAVEIYVHSPLLEGVHLRGAKVARGGIRWSDRAHDLRTEILDLMQTQMIKNALIVPQGAKGGFVVKQSGSNSLEREAQGREAYRDFINSLLTLTDNPQTTCGDRAPGVVAYDDYDPYLVVAADKGTATWSDLANQLSESHCFWLGDAFATGGSNGFHHKRLGITARGAWVCVRRHFRELDHDLEKEPITVVGVGSMDGDVFGNGMLESNNIRLVGAFSGDHIFIDPDPDPVISYAERRRLFQMPRSSWQDYDKETISQGGGVYRRDEKDIELSPQARSLLQARNRLIDGEALIRLLLTAPVDLLWMGGIGTYVKASFETDESVGDRANDGARVNANQLRAKVVGEGANLAFTRRGRVEYSLKGGKINSDAVDNSAGVDLSDHEVNLKIALHQSSLRSTSLTTEQARRLLADMTKDVCAAVLEDSYNQSLCLSLDQRRASIDVESFMNIADRFEAAGILNRENDAFPSRKDILSRTESGLTRPELALLMANAKLSMKRALLDEPHILEPEWVKNCLIQYFPISMRSCFLDEILHHSLAKEIALTVISNKIIDRAGTRFLLFDEIAAPHVLIDAVKTYLAFDEIMEADKWRQAIRNSENRMAIEQSYEYLQQVEEILAYLCRWALQRGRRLEPSKQIVGEWQRYLREYFTEFPQIVEAAIHEGGGRFKELFEGQMRAFPFMVDLARGSGKNIVVVARAFDAVAKHLGLSELGRLTAQTNPRDTWEALLQQEIEQRLRAATAKITAMMLQINFDDPRIFFESVVASPHLARLGRLRREVIEATPKIVAPIALFVIELEGFIEAIETQTFQGDSSGAKS